jgi:hypothetical protein
MGLLDVVKIKCKDEVVLSPLPFSFKMDEECKNFIIDGITMPKLAWKDDTKKVLVMEAGKVTTSGNNVRLEGLHEVDMGGEVGVKEMLVQVTFSQFNTLLPNFHNFPEVTTNSEKIKEVTQLLIPIDVYKVGRKGRKPDSTLPKDIVNKKTRISTEVTANGVVHDVSLQVEVWVKFTQTYLDSLTEGTESTKEVKGAGIVLDAVPPVPVTAGNDID